MARVLEPSVKTFAWGLFVVVLLGGAIALAVVALPLSRYEAAGGTDSGVVGVEVVSVVLRPTDLATSVSLSLVWSAQVEARSASSGLVSALFVEADRPVRCGVPVFEVDAQPVASFCGPRPLTSEVTSTSTGRDTDDFVAELRSAGFVDGGAAPTERQLEDGIRSWQSSLGMAIDGTAAPEDLLWLPGALTPTNVAVTVGSLVNVGDTVLSVEEHLVIATLAAASNDQLASGDRVFGLATSTERVPIGSDGSISDVSELETMLRGAGLLQNGFPETASGSSRLAEPVELVAVPPSSILTSTTGTCVIVAREDQRSPVAVEVVASSVGSVFVDGNLSAGAQVVVDPDRATSC